ncbi:MAG: imidazole glycerol phosphate synthase subunit HisH [Labilithrix sp.]|nr:imidazole glycerol phosphate synthase subunit HisH [Labilithrix sp.]
MIPVVVVDYGVGNVASIRNMFHRLGVACELSRDPERLATAERLVLPGVGAFDTGITQLREFGLEPVIREHAIVKKRPILGICLGMQLLFEGSDEGTAAGLGLVRGRASRFPREPGLTVPHMGWNQVHPRGSPRLFQARSDEGFDELELPLSYYFVHSYFVTCSDPDDVALKARHGVEFCAAVEHDNVCGVQFHPEKSHRYGMLCLKNFAELRPC